MTDIPTPKDRRARLRERVTTLVDSTNNSPVQVQCLVDDVAINTIMSEIDAFVREERITLLEDVAANDRVAEPVMIGQNALPFSVVTVSSINNRIRRERIDPPNPPKEAL